jgi:hypothetical protein
VQIADRRLQIRILVLLAMTALAACGHAAEKALVEQFFSASRLRDRTGAQSIATVFFDPKEQGLVRQFTIKSVAPEEESGGVVSKNVTISATVESLDGVKADKMIFVTMQRRPNAVWIITGVTVAAAAPSHPPR